MSQYPTDGSMPDRWVNGYAWMICEDCGAKLFDFDIGFEIREGVDYDRSRKCPTRRECNTR